MNRRIEIPDRTKLVVTLNDSSRPSPLLSRLWCMVRLRVKQREITESGGIRGMRVALTSWRRARK